jgi:hypothetical protein
LRRNIEKPVLNKKQTCSLEPKKNHFYSSLVKQTRALWFSMVLQRTPHPQYGVERDHGHGDATTVENQYYKEFGIAFTPLLQKSEAFSLRDSKGEAVVGYCDPLILRRLGASGFPEG